MSFSTDMAKLVADQLSRFATLNRHQLAGQVANLDFWLAQIRHALAGIDEYGVRFVRMQGAEEQYIAQRGAPEFDSGDKDGIWPNRPPPPHRVPDRKLRLARRALFEAAERFLERCRSEGLVTDVVASALEEFAE